MLGEANDSPSFTRAPPLLVVGDDD